MDSKGNIVKFTASAIDQVKKLMVSEGHNSDKCLRLGAKSGGCAGFSYVFEFDSQKDSDIYEEIEGFSIIVDKAQVALILNLEVDYELGLNNRGFIFKNPNAETTCGCGTSFS